MNQKKIIVTGGSGFLGRHLLRALSNLGHLIKNIDLVENPEFETTIADVRDTKKMREAIREADVVFHLASLIEAGESVREPQKYIDYNISGTVSVLEAMRQNKVNTFIFSSSAAVYGEPLQTPIKEDDRTIPINPYGMTKLAMEGLVSSYVKSHGMTGLALRYFNLYGPEENHQPETHAIPRFIQQINSGDQVTIWGSGQHQRDYIFIADVVKAHLQALDFCDKNQGKYHYLNLSTQQPTSVMQLVNLIATIIGKKPLIKHFPQRPGDPMVLIADATKAKEVLKWRAQVNLKSGLEKTIEYFLA